MQRMWKRACCLLLEFADWKGRMSRLHGKATKKVYE